MNDYINEGCKGVSGLKRRKNTLPFLNYAVFDTKYGLSTYKNAMSDLKNGVPDLKNAVPDANYAVSDLNYAVTAYKNGDLTPIFTYLGYTFTLMR